MKIAIYALFDLEHNLRYVGKSIDPVDRFRFHKKQRPWCFEYETIEWVGEEEWVDAEKFWIKFLRDIGYNLENKTVGGDGAHGLKHTEESKEKMRKAPRPRGYKRPHKPETIIKMKAVPRRRGYKMPPDAVEKSAAKRRGRKFSEESVKRLSDSHMGQTPWNKGKKGLQVAWNKGRLATKEEKEFLGSLARGRKHSEETKEKCRQAALGREVSEETRAKQRAAWERRRARVNETL